MFGQVLLVVVAVVVAVTTRNFLLSKEILTSAFAAGVASGWGQAETFGGVGFAVATAPLGLEAGALRLASGSRTLLTVSKAERGGDFVGPLIGKTGFRTSTEFAETLGARYQGFVDDAYSVALPLEAKGLLRGNANTRVGNYVDRVAHET